MLAETGSSSTGVPEDLRELASALQQTIHEELHTFGKHLLAEIAAIRTELRTRVQESGLPHAGGGPLMTESMDEAGAGDKPHNGLHTAATDVEREMRAPVVNLPPIPAQTPCPHPKSLESVRHKADHFKKKKKVVKQIGNVIRARRNSVTRVQPLQKIDEPEISVVDELRMMSKNSPDGNKERRPSFQSMSSERRVSFSSDISCDVESIASPASDEQKPVAVHPVRSGRRSETNATIGEVDARNSGGRLSVVATFPVGKAADDPIQRAVLSGWFDGVVCAALIVNAIFIGIQADRAALNEQTSIHFRYLEVAFCLFFTTELILRLYTFRIKFFTCGDKWNYFDLGLVVLQLCDEIVKTIFSDHLAGKDTSSMLRDMSIVRLVRVLRLLRILRLLRVIRFVSELKKVLYLIIGSLASFCWTAMLLTLLIYILAVFFTQIVADQSQMTVGGDPIEQQYRSTLTNYFGSTIVSIHTLYKAITGGFDWHEVSTPLIHNVSPLVGLVFACYTAFAVLVLLNLVTGVFVDGALKLSRADKELELLQKAYELFEQTDIDESGAITWEEFQAHLDTDQMMKFFDVLDINMARAEDLFHLIDGHDEGVLRLEELVAGGLMLQGPAKAIDVASLAKFIQQSMNHICAQLAQHQQLS